MNGTELIAAERQRQMEAEGWTSEHDNEHTHMELSYAAVCYVNSAMNQQTEPNPVLAEILAQEKPDVWPWSPEWWKPSHDPIRNLVKAGALIAAEIDRLERARQQEGYSILSGPREAML